MSEYTVTLESRYFHTPTALDGQPSCRRYTSSTLGVTNLLLAVSSASSMTALKPKLESVRQGNKINKMVMFMHK